MFRCTAMYSTFHKVSFLRSFLSFVSAFARPVSDKEAGTAALTWLYRNPRPVGTGLVPDSSPLQRAVRDEFGNALFHVVTFDEAGSHVLSADTRIAPVIAILDGGDVDESSDNPLMEILVANMAMRLDLAETVASADSMDYSSTILDEVIYNLFPDFDGEIISGRVLDAAGNPLVGAVVTAVCGEESVSVSSDDHGVYALFVEGDRTWTLRAERGDGTSVEIDVHVPCSVSTMVRGESISYDSGTV